MNPIDYCHDPFLRSLGADERAAIEGKLQLWGLYTPSFAEKLDNWFCNFDSSADKRLALKVFHALKYYSPEAFTNRLKQLYRTIDRHLADTNNNPSDIILVTPDGAGDSAERHVYDLVKQWGLSRNRVFTVSELSLRNFKDPVFVLFNDIENVSGLDEQTTFKRLEYKPDRMWVRDLAHDMQLPYDVFTTLCAASLVMALVCAASWLALQVYTDMKHVQLDLIAPNKATELDVKSSLEIELDSTVSGCEPPPR